MELVKQKSNEWVGVDLDRTLALCCDNLNGDSGAIGEPIEPMVQRVRSWLAAGVEVRIFTARLEHDDATKQGFLKNWPAWSETQFDQVLPYTNRKDFNMRELWDDRAVRVFRNTGLTLEDLVMTRLERLKQDRAVAEDIDHETALIDAALIDLDGYVLASAQESLLGY